MTRAPRHARPDIVDHVFIERRYSDTCAHCYARRWQHLRSGGAA